MSTSSPASNSPESQAGVRIERQADASRLSTSHSLTASEREPSSESEIELNADGVGDSILEDLPPTAPSPISGERSLSSPKKAHTHVHDPDAQRKLMNRLARIEGHVRGVRTMIARNEPCPDVLLQIAAVRGALDRVARLILDEHITECIAHAANSGDIKVELDELKKALDRFIG